MRRSAVNHIFFSSFQRYDFLLRGRENMIDRWSPHKIWFTDWIISAGFALQIRTNHSLTVNTLFHSTNHKQTIASRRQLCLPDIVTWQKCNLTLKGAHLTFFMILRIIIFCHEIGMISTINVLHKLLLARNIMRYEFFSSEFLSSHRQNTMHKKWKDSYWNFDFHS